MMIVDKTVKITVGRRNLKLVRNYYPCCNDRDLIEIPQKLTLEISKCSRIDCVCDQCGKEYSQTAGRIVEKPMREFHCGDCMHKYGQEKMILTMREDRKKLEQSKKLKSYCSTEIGKRQRKESGERHSKYLKSRTDLHEKFTANLPRMYGENHPNFNPNKDEYSEYMYKVRVITEKTYNDNIETINPEGNKRSLCGVDGGYQLDHIISVKQGFVEGISPEIIGGLDNLQMLPWEENRNKWHK